MELMEHATNPPVKDKLERNQSEYFQTLNQAKIKKKTEADRRLPSWLSHPTRFQSNYSAESCTSINELSDYFDESFIDHIKATIMIDKLLPVQRTVIPSICNQLKVSRVIRPRDVCVSSPTGSGKTLAYILPIVYHLKKNLSNVLKAIVILPTRDLAMQVYKIFLSICKGVGVSCFMTNSPEPSKESEFRSHILVCTPGNLTDLLHNAKWFKVSELEILVVDEADRLMTYQKHGWLEALERKIFSRIYECGCDPKLGDELINQSRILFSNITGCAMKNYWKSKHLHKLLFSATLSSDPQLLMSMNLFQPKLFLATKPTLAGAKIRNSLGGDSTSSTPDLLRANTKNEILTNTAIPEQLEEKIIIIEAKEKLFCIWYMFKELKYKRAICFVNKLETSWRLFKFINLIGDVRCAEFSSRMKPETREKIIAEFNKEKIDVIVCTDIMARGIDIENIEYVVSYDMPTSENFYVHRVGRTARAGNKGTAITLVDTTQLVYFKKIVQLAHKKTNSMRLSDVVEEMRIPKDLRKDPNKMDLFDKTFEDFQDQMKAHKDKLKYVKK